jgi:Rrf2 family protein|tara:strand:+ start:3380 stop:3811 length:432 start_codon:yes stop_codon:yes gene_type:complete
MFSKSCEYGIKALIYIANYSIKDKRVNIGNVAEAIDSPTAFTAKILQRLVKGGIVDSRKGPHGGFSITKERISVITLKEVVTIIDGDSVYNGCGLGLEECNEEKPCPLHKKFNPVRDKLTVMLEQTTLEDLASQLEYNRTFLK